MHWEKAVASGIAAYVSGDNYIHLTETDQYRMYELAIDYYYSLPNRVMLSALVKQLHLVQDELGYHPVFGLHLIFRRKMPSRDIYDLLCILEVPSQRWDVIGSEKENDHA